MIWWIFWSFWCALQSLFANMDKARNSGSWYSRSWTIVGSYCGLGVGQWCGRRSYFFYVAATCGFWCSRAVSCVACQCFKRCWNEHLNGKGLLLFSPPKKCSESIGWCSEAEFSRVKRGLRRVNKVALSACQVSRGSIGNAETFRDKPGLETILEAMQFYRSKRMGHIGYDPACFGSLKDDNAWLWLWTKGASCADNHPKRCLRTLEPSATNP